MVRPGDEIFVDEQHGREQLELTAKKE